MTKVSKTRNAILKLVQCYSVAWQTACALKWKFSFLLEREFNMLWNESNLLWIASHLPWSLIYFFLNMVGAGLLSFPLHYLEQKKINWGCFNALPDNRCVGVFTRQLGKKTYEWKLCNNDFFSFYVTISLDEYHRDEEIPRSYYQKKSTPPHLFLEPTHKFWCANNSIKFLVTPSIFT